MLIPCLLIKGNWPNIGIRCQAGACTNVRQYSSLLAKRNSAHGKAGRMGMIALGRLQVGVVVSGSV